MLNIDEKKEGYKTLVIDNTYYSLLLYILWDKKWREKDYCIVNERISAGFITRLRQLVNKVIEVDYFPRLRLKYPVSSIMQRRRFIKLLNNYSAIYGNVYELKVILNGHKKWIQIDDGELTYSQLSKGFETPIPFKKIRNTHLLKKIFAVDYDFDFLKIDYLLPDSIRYRDLSKKYNANLINMKLAYNNLTIEEQKSILELFGLNPSSSTGKNLILMQPIFTDGLVKTVEEEINLYKFMLNKLQLDESECVFKPHPASRVDYINFFPKANFISNDFPSELLPLTGNDFDKIITLFSSGLSSFENSSGEIYYFGGLWLNLPVQLSPYKIINGKTSHFNVDR